MKDRSYKEKNYSSTTGHICEYVKKTESVMRNGRYRTETAYYPVYEYSVDGVTYRVRSITGSSTHSKYGKSVTIYYNPNNPEEAIVNGDKKGAKIGVWFGIVFIIAGSIGIFVTIIGKTKKKTGIHSYTENGTSTNDGYNPYGTYTQSGGYDPYGTNNNSSGYNPYNANNTSDGYNSYNTYTQSNEYDPYPQKKQKSLEDFPDMHNDIG